MVNLPPEERVTIAVMYIRGRAQYWWCGTGCNAYTVQWHHFCRMVGERFSDSSEYDVIGQFHNLKQIGSVSSYIDKFEIIVGLIRRDHPNLPNDY